MSVPARQHHQKAPGDPQLAAEAGPKSGWQRGKCEARAPRTINPGLPGDADLDGHLSEPQFPHGSSGDNNSATSWGWGAADPEGGALIWFRRAKGDTEAQAGGAICSMSCAGRKPDPGQRPGPTAPPRPRALRAAGSHPAPTGSSGGCPRVVRALTFPGEPGLPGPLPMPASNPPVQMFL